MAGLFVVLGIVGGISIIWVVRMKRVILKIWSMTPLERYCKLNVLLERYGFYYEAEQDVFLKRSDCVTKNRRIKREKKNRKNSIAASFVYGSQNYLLCISQKQKGIFWQIKVQFFIEGRRGRYYPMKGKQCLDMALVFYNKGNRNIIIGQKGWQLLVRKPCCLYDPERMKLRVRIIFPDSNMALAFTKGVREAGWRFVVLSRDCTGVMLDILSMQDAGKTKKRLFKKVVQRVNRTLIYAYFSITKPFYKTVDRMLFFHEMLPFLFPLLFWGEKMCCVSKGEG